MSQNIFRSMRQVYIVGVWMKPQRAITAAAIAARFQPTTTE